MSSEPITDSPDPRLQAALAEYLERIDQGEAVDRVAFLAEYPNLAEELAPLLETADALELIGGNTSEPRTPDVSTHSQLSHDIETMAPGRQGQEATTSGPLPAEFGRYRVIKPLGQGAMGVVYLADDTQLHRQVALKTSSFDNDHSGELLERFYREARSAANLRHPNICPVYDVGEIQGRHYISLAYIEGRTLATYVNANGSLHERQVLVLVRKLALALEEAHKHEVVHRDLKPANIMVDLRGEPIIMDFGLARVGYSADESRLTQVGMIVGSPAYMAPEQIGGQPELLTGAADQYSLGVILFELLIGHPPFRGPVTAVVGQILTQPPPRPRSLRSDLSSAVEALCLKMLSKSPSDRFASMKHVADEIAALLRGSSAEQRPLVASAKSGSEDRSQPETSTPKTSLHEALIQEARHRLKQRDYPKAIEMLQQIPEAERPPEAAKLLAQALKLMDEVNFVLQEMEAALQSRDGATLAKRAQELVKLKPDHPRARQVRELIKKYGPERALQFLAENSGTTPAPPVDRGSQRRVGLIAGGIVALLLGIVIWFGSGKTRLKVTVNDPTIEVTFRGSQLSIRDGVSQVEVEPGDEELTIRVAGVEFQTPKFSLKKGTTSVVEVERAEDKLAVNLAGKELAAWPLDQAAAAPLGTVTATQPDTPTADPNDEIDLLAAVDVSQLGDSDMKWERKGQTVVCTGTGAAGKSAWKGFRLPTEIGGDYEVELEFQQRAFWPMQIDFPLQDTAVRVSLTGDYCDLMIEDDKSQPNAEKTWRSTATKLKTMVPQKLVVRVRQSGTRAVIKATLDGVTLGTYSGERSRIVLPSWVKPNVKQITSGSLCGNLADGYIELRKAVYRPLSPVSPEIASPPAVSPPHKTTGAATTISFPQNGRFTAARPLTEVNQGEPINAYPWITPDGLSLYWTRETQNVDSTVMQATRSSTDAPFGDIKPVLRHARLASVSSDGLEIVCPFDANGDGKPEELCTSRRATTSQEFPTPQAIPTLAGLHHALGSAFSEDGQRLIVLAAPQPNTTRIIHRVERSGPGAAWGTPRAVTIPNTSPEMDKITWPSLASGKYLIFSYQDPTNRPVEWGCVADATSDPLAFANPRHMLLDSERFIVRGGRYCPATGELFYTHSSTTPPFEKLEIRVARADVVPVTPPSNPEEGWTDLFNGRDLTGWTPMGFQGWRVENGILIGESKTERGWLRTDTVYDNFELDFEYRLSPGTISGVFLRAWLNGGISGQDFHEIQILDESDEDYRQLSAVQRTGALYGQLAASPLTELRPNLWYRMNIAVHGDDIRVQVNGQEVTRGKVPSGKLNRGHIGLQLLPVKKPQRCEFRKLRVRPLKDGLPVAGAPAQPNEPMAKNEPIVQPAELDDPDDSDEVEEVRNGLKAEIFAGQNFERKVTEKIEPNLDCFWNLAAPAVGAPVDGFSVRFSGWLKAPRSGRYKIGFWSDDGLRVSLDGKKVIDDWKVGAHVREVSVELTDQPQSILVETFDHGGPAYLTAYWLPTGQATPCLIQSEAFFPTEASARAPTAKTTNQRQGLIAEYFDLPFQRKYATHRVVRAETTWFTATPTPGLPTALAARYSGYVVPPTTGQYKLVALGDDWMRVWIDNKPALEAKFEHGIQTALISLDAGKAHAIRIEHANSYLDGEYFLHWVEPGKTEEVSIPPECLFPTKSSANRAASKKQNVKTPEKPVEKANVTDLPEVRHGLKAEIFEGRNFDKKIAEQIEPNVECFWELGAPAKEAPVDNFSVRFSGWLRAPKTGRYKLFLSSKDGSRLKINHQTLIDNWKLKPEVAEVSVELTQDPQPIEVEVFNADLYSWVSLLWQPAGTATVCHIPATALYPDLENARSKASRTNIEKTGLVAEYFDKSFGRRLATDRVYRIEEIWGPHSPRWGLPTDSAAKYTGVLVPPVSGQYKLVTSARGHIRVWIDDKPTVEAKGIQTAQNAVVELEANKQYEIRVEILTTGHGAHYLHWIPPGTTKEVSIPPECLFPNKAAVRQVISGPVIKAPTEEKPTPNTISAAERETIERGLAQLKAADEAAGKKLLKDFDAQIEKVRAAPKLSADERVVRIKSLEDEKSLFEKHGHIPFSLAMRTETLKYLREFTEARTDTAKVYDRLIESLTKRKSDEAASLLRTERDIAVGPKVVAIWRTVEVSGGKKTDDWSIWSNGSVGKSNRQFLWMMDERRFAIQWTRTVDTFVFGEDCTKASIVNENGVKIYAGERVAP